MAYTEVDGSGLLVRRVRGMTLGQWTRHVNVESFGRAPLRLASIWSQVEAHRAGMKVRCRQRRVSRRLAVERRIEARVRQVAQEMGF